MSYTTKHLMSGEEIMKETRLHWIVYVPSAILLALSILLFAAAFAAGEAAKETLILPELFIGGSVFGALAAFVKRSSSEFVVTNKRVLVKRGWLRRRSTEILLRQVEGITVDQGILGRMLDYGTIVIEGTGSDRTPYKGIAGPMAFRLAVQEQIERNTNLASPSAPPQQQTSKDDPYTMLLKLNDLKEKGILTDEEYRKEKAKILGA
jgi:uncharacterized membrane protein YdbT with pleckstrin-like domain